MDAPAVERTLARMADEIAAQAGGDELVLVGIHRRGVQLADRLARDLDARTPLSLSTGSLDITLYLDELMVVGPRPRQLRRQSRVLQLGKACFSIVQIDARCSSTPGAND